MQRIFNVKLYENLDEASHLKILINQIVEFCARNIW